jgi:epoxyqueuosine reductase
MMTPAERVKERGKELGFDLVGVARAGALDPEGDRLREWLGRGYEAGMTWMRERVEKRSDPRRVLPGARSVIAVAVNYYTPAEHRPEGGKISRYAWGDDYHDILSGRLEQFRAWLAGAFPGAESKVYVDTGPVMEKAWAARAGIGWQGKHTNVITREVGSWVFLGEILTTLDLEPDAPALDHCGTCVRCIEACPTGAIVEPYLVDSRLCLSYLTIEHRGPVEGEVTARYEGWIYGCDICQDVCPWNEKFSLPSDEPGFAPREGFVDPELELWRGMTQAEFSARFKGSPIKRTKREGLVRNIGIVGEAGDPSGVPGASHPAKDM